MKGGRKQKAVEEEEEDDDETFDGNDKLYPESNWYALLRSFYCFLFFPFLFYHTLLPLPLLIILFRDIFDEDLGPVTEAEKKKMKDTKVYFKQVIEKSSDSKTDMTYLYSFLFFSFLFFSFLFFSFLFFSFLFFSFLFFSFLFFSFLFLFRPSLLFYNYFLSPLFTYFYCFISSTFVRYIERTFKKNENSTGGGGWQEWKDDEEEVERQRKAAVENTKREEEDEEAEETQKPKQQKEGMRDVNNISIQSINI